MMPEKTWRCVRVDGDREGPRVRLLSMVRDGVRYYREEHYTAPSPDGERALLHERYYTTDPERAYRSLEALLASLEEPVEPNHP